MKVLLLGDQMTKQKEIALVTGGASGMGLATVRRLAEDGFSVVFVDRNGALAEKETLRLRGEGLDVSGHCLDITQEAEVRTFVKTLGPVFALVNNAGVFEERAFESVTSDDFRRVYEVNLIAATTLTQSVVLHMPDGGRIVNIASRAYLGARGYPHYAASKAALVGYTLACALELAPRKILVNAIAPGLIETPLLKGLSAERRTAMLSKQPMGDAGQPEHVAQAVSFLTSPRTGFITGQVLLIDGGRFLAGGG